MLAGESYRQFYDRLVAHSRMHLVGKNVAVDGILSGTTGEKMSISLLNFIALSWLQKINAQLVGIVKVEYSRELREQTPLASLVPRIANNIDAMLRRHDVAAGINLVVKEDASINKVKTRKSSKSSFRSDSKSPYCPDCYYLGKKLSLQVDSAHFPNQCPRPKAAINMLLADMSVQEGSNNETLQEDITGNDNNYDQALNSSSIQSNLGNQIHHSSMNISGHAAKNLQTLVFNILQRSKSIRKECFF